MFDLLDQNLLSEITKYLSDSDLISVLQTNSKILSLTNHDFWVQRLIYQFNNQVIPTTLSIKEWYFKLSQYHSLKVKHDKLFEKDELELVLYIMNNGDMSKEQVMSKIGFTCKRYSTPRLIKWLCDQDDRSETIDSYGPDLIGCGCKLYNFAILDQLIAECSDISHDDAVWILEAAIEKDRWDMVDQLVGKYVDSIDLVNRLILYKKFERSDQLICSGIFPSNEAERLSSYNLEIDSLVYLESIGYKLTKKGAKDAATTDLRSVDNKTTQDQIDILNMYLNRDILPNIKIPDINNVEIIDWLVQHTNILFNLSDDEWDTMFVMHDLDLIKYLVKQGYLPNKIDYRCMHFTYEEFRLLYDAGYRFDFDEFYYMEDEIKEFIMGLIYPKE